MILPYEQRVRIKIDRSTIRFFAGVFVLIFILAALFEALFRIPAIQELVPFQAYGTNHIQFEIQLQNLSKFIIKNGEPNCFILGNSQSLRSIDPFELGEVFHQQNGDTLNCYNFSIVGTNISTTLLFSQILINHYDPELFIVGLSFMDFSEARENRYDPRFEENAWIDQQIGRTSLKGWLLEHSYAYRTLILISYGAPHGMKYDDISKELRKWNSQLGATGYAHSQNVYPVNEQPKPGFVDNFLDEFGNFSVSEWNISSLDSMIELANEQDIQVLIVEMPFHPSLLNMPDNSGQTHEKMADLKYFIDQVNHRIRDISSEYDIPYWEFQLPGAIEDDGWHDRYHLNSYSSPAFSQWLAVKMAEALRQGQMNIPSGDP